METARIESLLQPFLLQPLSQSQLQHISTYIDILLRWNAKLNLTAIREPEEIVTRHFGESLFAAQHLFKDDALQASVRVLDIGSGAGFPGLPIKLWAPPAHVTLIESNQKRATFLREAIRALTLTNIDVFAGRAEDFPAASADLVIMRAVERFDIILPTAHRLLCSSGRLALLIGEPQTIIATAALPDLQWAKTTPVPQSRSRLLLVGSKAKPHRS